MWHRKLPALHEQLIMDMSSEVCCQGTHHGQLLSFILWLWVVQRLKGFVQTYINVLGHRSPATVSVALRKLVQTKVTY